MSRWHDQFNNHEFRTSWNEFKELLNTIVVDDETDVTSIAEIARLKKVTAYLESLIENADPEIVPGNIWDSFNAQISTCLQHLQQYVSDRDIIQITRCNTSADNLLTYVRPFIVTPREALVSTKRAAIAYSQVAENYVQLFGEKAKNLIREIESSKTATDEIYQGITSRAGLVEGLEVKLFGNDQSIGIEQKIDDLAKKAEEQAQTINTLHDELLVGANGELATKNSIIAAKSDVDQNRLKIEEALAEVKEEIGELKGFHSKVFGKPDKTTGERMGGLALAFEALKKSLTDFESVQKTRYVALNREIESLLPGATNAGLAKAYQDMKLSFDDPIRKASRLFYVCVASLVLVSLMLAIESISWSQITFIKLTDWTTVFKSLAYKFPFYGPIVWLAYFASKRRSESQRLQQEYAHKEALASSYNSYQKQILALDEKDTEMRKELIRKVIDAIANNASLTLDGKHGDQMPLQEAIDLIASNASKFKPS